MRIAKALRWLWDSVLTACGYCVAKNRAGRRCRLLVRHRGQHEAPVMGGMVTRWWV